MSGGAEKKRAGFVTVIGIPNAGKSTLINAMVGSKVSIVSKKIQTTRSRVLGIVTKDQAQVILIDTPGVFAPKKTLEKAMVKAAWDSLNDSDVIIHLVDATVKNIAQANAMIIDKLPERGHCVLVLNKTDKVRKSDLLALSQSMNDQFPYGATFMVSALKDEGVADLQEYLAGHVPEGPWLFDGEQITDIPMRLLAAEITREKIFEQLHQELPYAIMVETENWEHFDNGSVKIDQVIYVKQESQKAIVVGKGGSRIKKIGEAARVELEDIFDSRIHLKLFVKVQENWTERPENYQLIGLEFGG